MTIPGRARPAADDENQWLRPETSALSELSGRAPPANDVLMAGGVRLQRERVQTAIPSRHRRVGLRPAPDTMAVLTGYLPVEQGVACLAALRRPATPTPAAHSNRPRCHRELHLELPRRRSLGGGS